MSGGNFICNARFKVFSSPGILLGEYPLDAEILDIGNRDIVLGLSWLKENGFVVDPLARCLRNVVTGLILPCSVRMIPAISILDLDNEPLEDGEVMLIIDASKRYNRYAQIFSTEQAARLPEHKS
jgi:hypothetical protein